MPDPKNLVAARKYCENSWKVFPLRPKDKRPLTAHGFHDATDDLKQVERWWLATPLAGIGVPTGSVNEIIVLDVDPRNGGDESLRAVLAQFGALPDTVTGETGGGGTHYFFKHPGGVLPSVKNAWPGLDIKADGGYVAVPFTIHPSGLEYRWAQGKDPGSAFALCPEWIVNVLTESKQARMERMRPVTKGDEELVISEGGRNDALTSLAGTMHRRAMSYDAILVALLAENVAKCDPALDEDEVKAIVDSVCGRYTPDPEESVGKVKTKERLVIRYVDNAMLRSRPPDPVEWLVADRIAKGDCTVLYGPPSAGKSWLALDLAIAGAAGLPPLGYFKLDKPFRTIIVDEENTMDEVWRRYHLICKAWEITDLADLDDKVRITFPCQGLGFRLPGFQDALIEEVRAFQPDLLILDSITAISSLKDENDPLAVRRFFHDCLYPIRDVCGSAILLIHHTNKAVYKKDREVRSQGLARGSIDLIAAPDSSLFLEPVSGRKAPGLLRLEQTKLRRGKVPDVLHLSIVDGLNGGARPLVRLAAPNTPVRDADRTGSDASQCRTVIVGYFSKFPKGTRKSTTDVVTHCMGLDVQYSAPTVRMALGALVERKVLAKEKDPSDKRAVLYFCM